MRSFLNSFIKSWCALSLTVVSCQNANASSHREAPYVTETPKVDGTDFYMFTSYEQGRSDYVTIIANYQGLQDAFGGPNYFTMDPEAHYDIHIDNNGDALEDLTFRFQFTNALRDVALPIGTGANRRMVSVPLVNVGAITATDKSKQNVFESYTLSLVRDRKDKKAKFVTNAATGSFRFDKPIDNIGLKSIADYGNYAARFVYPISIPGCGGGRLFVGQRRDGFAVNLGETFDLINFKNPVGPENAEQNIISDKNVTTMALEIPKSCLTNGSNPVIAAWTTASLPQKSTISKAAKRSFENPANTSGSYVQVSRLANPLVNELVVGVKDKDKFNGSRPKDDGQFLTYVTNPTLPALIEALFPGVLAPTLFPRTDLIAIYLTGIQGLNKTTGVGEMMRLNTSIAPTAAASQNQLGVIAGDNAGYPNGRRPGDDVVDISLRALMGVLLPQSQAPAGQLPFTDGAAIRATDFPANFPYLQTPVAGSPNPNSPN